MKKVTYYLLAIFIIIFIVLVAMIRKDVPVEELKAQYANEDSKFMKIDGMDVHYRDEGKGTPLVLIHGIGSSLNTWDGWEEHLQGSFRIIRLDLPGFGLTGPHANHDYSIEFYVTFMKTFLDNLKIDSCYMAGNSLGGYITWNVAAAYPNLVKRIILIDAAGYPFSPDATPFVFKLVQSPIAPLLKNVTPRFLVAQIINQVYGDDSKVTDEVIDRYYHQILREGNRDAFLDLARNIQFTQYEKLKSINTPALILWGGKDTWVKPICGKRFDNDLPHSELIMYPSAGHIPMEEIPEQTAHDAKRFLLGDLINFGENVN
ncbi:MAG: alpha/beta hydrolase [Bacteroidia bacterium]